MMVALSNQLLVRCISDHPFIVYSYFSSCCIGVGLVLKLCCYYYKYTTILIATCVTSHREAKHSLHLWHFSDVVVPALLRHHHLHRRSFCKGINFRLLIYPEALKIAISRAWQPHIQHLSAHSCTVAVKSPCDISVPGALVNRLLCAPLLS